MLFLNHPLVRAYYLKHGRVYTLRGNRRKRDGLQAIVQGSRFKHRPVGRGIVVLIREFKALTPRGLAGFVRRSGFKSSKDWMEAYVQINGGKQIEPIYLYQVLKDQGNPVAKNIKRGLKEAVAYARISTRTWSEEVAYQMRTDKQFAKLLVQKLKRDGVDPKTVLPKAKAPKRASKHL